nr:MAG TPA: hypothetical protein [Bacteriophage sp.]
MDITNFADENSIKNQEAELDSMENEDEILDEEENQEEAELDSMENEDEEEKSQKKRKSGVPKLLAEKNRQAETIKSMAQKIREQEEEIKRLKNDEDADESELDEARREKRMLEMKLADKLSEEYPEVDLDEAKAYAKKENLSLTNAFKLLNMDIVEKQGKAQTKSLTGSHYEAGTRVYTQKDLAKMSQAEYNKAIEQIERGKARFQN